LLKNNIRKKRYLLCFIGGGERLEEIKSTIAAANFTDKCRFIGWRKDAHEILRVADIFILTSLWEGLPRSLVEALKTGLPSVCYNTDGVSDILKSGTNGYLIKQGDNKDMYNKISLLLEDENIRRNMSIED